MTQTSQHVGIEVLSLEMPKSINEVADIVSYARKNGCQLRVVGAQHSTEEMIYGLDAACKEQERRAGAPKPRPLIVLSMKHFDSIEMVPPKRDNGSAPKDGRPCVRVEAGVHFAEQPYIHPVPAAHAQLHRWLARQGLAINLTGGIAHQTVAGFLATGSSGGSWRHSLHDSVVAIELVDGTGTYRRLERGAQGEAARWFSAAGVSLGLLGVVVAVTLQLEQDFHVVGKEEFRTLRGDENRDALVRSFCREHEYGRLIWWPQIDALQLWSCERVVPRRDAQPIPYLPVGQQTLPQQTVACLLLGLCGNLRSLDDLRTFPARLRQSRIVEYLELSARQRTLRPMDQRETQIEVLDREPHYHWKRSRFRAPRRLKADDSPLDHLDSATFPPTEQEQSGQWHEAIAQLATGLGALPESAFQRFIERIMLAAADEAVKRLLYLAVHGEPQHSAAQLRRELDGYGNVISGMFAPDRDVGGIGVDQPLWRFMERLWQWLTGTAATVSELADHLGEYAAAVLIPLAGHSRPSWVLRLVYTLLRAALYERVPGLIGNFFEPFLGTRTGFFDDAFHGLAMDKRMNHHLVQTKFSELWVQSADAGRVLEALRQYMRGSDGDDPTAADDPADLQAALLEALQQQPSADAATSTPESLATALCDRLARLPAVTRFERQGAYSMEIYGGKSQSDFLLHPGYVNPRQPDDGWVRFNFFWFAFNAGGPRDHFEQYWRLFKEKLPDVTFRCHWGKEIPQAGLQPHWDNAFQDNVKTFLGIRTAFDPDGVFYTDYHQRVLERS